MRACSCAQARHHTTRVGRETLSGRQNGANKLSVTCSRCWWIARSRPHVSDSDWRSCACLLCSALAANFRSTPLSDFAGGSTASPKTLDEPVCKLEQPGRDDWRAVTRRRATCILLRRRRDTLEPPERASALDHCRHSNRGRFRSKGREMDDQLPGRRLAKLFFLPRPKKGTGCATFSSFQRKYGKYATLQPLCVELLETGRCEPPERACGRKFSRLPCVDFRLSRWQHRTRPRAYHSIPEVKGCA